MPTGANARKTLTATKGPGVGGEGNAHTRPPGGQGGSWHRWGLPGRSLWQDELGLTEEIHTNEHKDGQAIFDPIIKIRLMHPSATPSFDAAPSGKDGNGGCSDGTCEGLCIYNNTSMLYYGH